MMWQKEFGYDYHRNKDFLLMSIIILSIFALVVNRPLLFLIVGLFGAYLILNVIYDKYVGSGLTLKNDRQVLRLFPEDESMVTMKWYNDSIIPYINGKLQFQVDQNISSSEFIIHVEERVQTLTIPLSILNRRQITLNIPIVAKKRGVTRLRNMSYEVPHLFNFDELRLKYSGFFALEIIVYPKLLTVKRSKELFELQPGEDIVHFSPFEDILSPLGTRKYSYSDPFQKINWKATAKTGQLQTNIYDKTIEHSYLFIVNLSTVHATGQATVSSNIESLLSYAAYLAKEATKANKPYEVMINAQRFGERRYIHLAKGQGRGHYMKTLDMLARIHPLSVRPSFIEMLYHIQPHVLAANVIVIIGEIPETTEELLKTWQQQHKRLYHVKEQDQGAILRPWVKDVMSNEG